MLWIIFTVMKNANKIKTGLKESDQSVTLRTEGLVVYPPSENVLKIIHDSKDYLDTLFLKASIISDMPPVRQYVLNDEELCHFSKLYTQKNSDDLIGAFSIKYTIAYAYLIEYLQYDGEFSSSHIWHTDGYLKAIGHHKLFYYLTDTTENNGAFQYQSLASTKNLLRNGFISSYPERKDQNKAIRELLNIEENICSVGGVAGSSFVFNPSVLIHRAGPRLQGSRRALVFELLPAKKDSPSYLRGGSKNFLSVVNVNSAINHWFNTAC